MATVDTATINTPQPAASLEPYRPKNVSLTPAQVSIIKSTVPILAEHGATITTRFYGNMLAAHPELKTVFNLSNMKTGRQPAALAGALYAYAANIDNLGALGPAVELICQRHASLYIRPEQYETVGTYLLAAMKEILGAALTDDVAEAWATAYWQLADICIAKEAELYAKAGEWKGWAPFKIAHKVKESEEITSFYLEPMNASNKPLPDFLPGQYISIRTLVPTLGHIQPRQYSLSDAPNGSSYRVSVKREAGVDPYDPSAATHPGIISNVMHDVRNEGDIVEVSHPYGDFYFDTKSADKDAPVVLLSAGVGLTCLTSILNSLIDEKSDRPISYIHGVRHSDLRAFKAHMQDLAKANPNLKVVLFNKYLKDGEVQGVDYHHSGRLNLDKLSKEDLHVGNPKTQYYVCGPERFMTDIENGLKQIGVAGERIHSEKFGPNTGN
ncbi:globin-like protein [Rhizodiscina lignyota]|uniref:nitric oxide dioxygenase n=1 Tax=Rhizodiscina lignyota TaxID=1504668 RepID=A0A9P4MAW4_9PEZI|nr:globin-like protein [Rhizodiscina lignyota]